MHACMHAWMDGWMDGCMHGWMDGWKLYSINVGLSICFHVRTYVSSYGMLCYAIAVLCCVKLYSDLLSCRDMLPYATPCT